MSKYAKRILSVLFCAVFAAAFIVIINYVAPTIPSVPEAQGEIPYVNADGLGQDDGGTSLRTENLTAVIGTDVTAVRISDLCNLGKITKVNYVADSFVYPNSLSKEIRIVDLTKPFEFAKKGTLIFIVLNLDPYSEDFDGQTKLLSEYKEGDYWRFTFSLPKIFTASNVYLGSDVVACNGEIEDYSFISFTTSYNRETKVHSAETAYDYVDLKFYTRRQAMERVLASASVITVHYESSGTVYSGIADCPLIGVREAVTGIRSDSQNLLIAFAILSAVMFAVLAALSILKRTVDYVPEIIWTSGICILLLARFILGQATHAPLFFTAVTLSCPFIILGGALLSMGKNYGRIPLKYIFTALVFAGAALAFVRPFVPYAAANALIVIYTGIKEIGTAALFAFVGLATFRKNDGFNTLKPVCAALIAVSVSASLFLPQVSPAFYDSELWLCAATVFLTFVNVFMLINKTEKANIYLTNNLHLEVERQVKDIKAVIAERDNLLQFVSHDMKKPLVSSQALLDTVIERESDGEQAKALQIVRQNTARVVSNLSEIGSYARFNYIAEPSQVTDLYELCASIYGFHYPDCNANGIILKNLVEERHRVYVKQRGLENAVSNIIMNAVEHADCTTITLSVRSEKNRTVLCVADDGKGIDSSVDVFRAYVSEDRRETGGLGLYICRNIIESMNGGLTYESGSEGTVFHISLLKA